MLGEDRIELRLRGRIRRADLPRLCSRTCAELRGAPAGVTLICHVAGVVPDVVSVEALARLKLAARRGDVRLILSGVTSEMRELIGLLGLDEVLEVQGGD
jgi:ABC-type transporter Mla MlaB component